MSRVVQNKPMTTTSRVRYAIGRSANSRSLGDVFTRGWFELLVSDPGHMRFRAACRATLSAVVTGASLSGLAAWHVIPPAAAGIGVALAIMGILFVRDPLPRQRMLTVATMGLCSVISAAVAAVLAMTPYLSEGGFLALIFAVVALQTRGPRVVATGILSVMSAYLALFLRLTPAQAPTVLLAVAIAAIVVLVIGTVLLPERPSAALTRMVRTIARRASLILHALAETRHENDPARLRARRSFARLNETILSAEELLAIVAPAAIERFRTGFVRFEIALADVAVAAAAARPLTKIDIARVRLAALRLHAGRRGPTRPRDDIGGAPSMRGALRALDDAAIGLTAMTRDGVQRPSAPILAPVAPRPAPAWRPAARATTAALLSMVGGHVVSPDRWFWAVLTAYLLFINVRSRGETIVKGVQRIWGALAGLAVGLLISFAFAGHAGIESAGILLCLFGLAYAFPLFPGLVTFCITVLFGLTYSMAGVHVGTVLTLRLEETVIGVASALVAGFLIFPRGTQEHVQDVGSSLLAALAEAVRTSARRLEGDLTASPLGAMRQADRMMRDLRAALKPLQAGRSLSFVPAPTELPAVISCMFWARHLASLSDTDDAVGDHTVAAGRARDLAAKLEAIGAEGPPSRQSACDSTDGSSDRPFAVPSIDAPKAVALAVTLDNLDGATDLLATRLGADGWKALIRKRRL